MGGRLLSLPLRSAGLFCLLLASAVAGEDDLGARLRARAEAAGTADSLQVLGEPLHARAALRSLYVARDYRPLWVGAAGLNPAGTRLIAYLQGLDAQGLSPAPYHVGRFARLRALDSPGARTDLELALSDAFLLAGRHLLSGRLDPETIDPEWVAYPRAGDLLPLLANMAPEGDPATALDSLRPRGPGYAGLVAALADLRRVAAQGGWPPLGPGPVLRLGDSGPRVARLAERLRLGGDLEGEGGDAGVFDQPLDAALRRFQTRHGLEADGVVGPATRAALDVPVGRRIDQLRVNLERWRWLPEDLGRDYILVNIADYHLALHLQDAPALEMRVVVGRSYRRTPVFSGRVSYLVFNPAWEVPTRIAVLDKLPAIQADPDFLAANHFEVLQGWGAEERRIDPATLDWAALGRDRFPYRLRQRPGPWNALGRVKFMFPNRFSVYLHDTPTPELFARPSRGFSSGCIRLERPLELAERLLAREPGWSRGRIDQVVASGETLRVSLSRPVPVHLQYWTAWVDEAGRLNLRDDIYGRDRRVLEALDRAPGSSADVPGTLTAE